MRAIRPRFAPVSQRGTELEHAPSRLGQTSLGAAVRRGAVWEEDRQRLPGAPLIGLVYPAASSPTRPCPRLTPRSWVASAIRRARARRELVEAVRLPDHRECHVAHRDASGRDALFRSVVRVTVHDEVGTGTVDGLPQQVTAEKRIDLVTLGPERVFDGRVVQQRDSYVSFQLLERTAQAFRDVLRRLQERLHLGFAEVAPARAGKSASEAFAPGDTERVTVDVDDGARSFEDRDACVVEDLRQRTGAI